MTEAFTAHVQRRWADLDAQGHVNNSPVLEYVREAWAQFASARSVTAPLASSAPVALAQVQYLQPVHHGRDPLRVSVGFGEHGAGRVVLESLVWQGDVPAARARLVLRASELTPAHLDVLDGHRVGDAFGPLRDLPVGPLDGRGLVYDLTPRLSDVNQRGELDEVALYTYVQEARVAVMEQIDPAMARLGAAESVPLVWFIAQQDVYYRAPAPYRLAPYRMRTAVVRLGRSSITLNAELCDPARPGDVLMRAATVSVCAGVTGRPMPLPASMRAALEPHCIG